MDVVEISPGKYLVLLGGKVRSCIFDTDCPGAAICALNQIWQISPNEGMCMCNTRNGFAGATCEKFCSEAILALIVAVFFLLSSIVAIASTVWVIILKSQKRKKRILRPGDPMRTKPSCVSAVLYVILLGGILALTCSVLGPITALGYPWIFEVHPDPGPKVTPHAGQGIKRIPIDLDKAFWTLSAISHCVGTLSVILLPFVWIDSTRLTLHMRQRKRLILKVSVITGIMTGFMLTQLCFYFVVAKAGGPLGGRNADLNWILVIDHGWTIIFGAVGIINLAACIRVTFVLRSANPSAAVTSTLRRIQLAGLLICITAWIAVVLSIVFDAFGKPRLIYADPRCYIDKLASLYRSRRCCILVMMLIAIWSIIPPNASSIGNGGEDQEEREQERGCGPRCKRRLRSLPRGCWSNISRQSPSGHESQPPPVQASGKPSIDEEATEVREEMSGQASPVDRNTLKTNSSDTLSSPRINPTPRHVKDATVWECV